MQRRLYFKQRISQSQGSTISCTSRMFNGGWLAKVSWFGEGRGKGRSTRVLPAISSLFYFLIVKCFYVLESPLLVIVNFLVLVNISGNIIVCLEVKIQGVKVDSQLESVCSSVRAPE